MMKRPTFLITALALAALFFGWRTYEAWTNPVVVVAAPPVAGTAAVPALSASPDPSVPADLSGMAASIIARPVFRPDRKPFREEAAPAPPKRNYEAEMARFTLLGVLLLGNEKKGVVVGKAATGREERWEVAPGDSLPGFTVKDIGADGLTLSADDKEFLLPLYAGGPKGTAGQPVRTDVGPPRQQTSAPPAAKGGSAPAPAPGTAPAARPVSPTVTAPVAPPASAAPPASDPQDSNRGRLMRPTYMPGRR
jgi:hypothetical protein